MSDIQANPFATTSNNNSSLFRDNFWDSSATTDKISTNVFEYGRSNIGARLSSFDNTASNPFSNLKHNSTQQSPFTKESHDVVVEGPQAFDMPQLTTGRIITSSDHTQTFKSTPYNVKSPCPGSLNCVSETTGNFSADYLNTFDDAPVLDAVIKGQDVDGLYQKVSQLELGQPSLILSDSSRPFNRTAVVSGYKKACRPG